MNFRISRRRFLQTSAAAGASLTILPAGAARGYAANEKLNVALIGVGGRGTWFVGAIPPMENVVALCDVDQEKIEGAFRQWTKEAERCATCDERKAQAEQEARVAEASGEMPEMSFSTFTVSLATSAYVHLGLSPNPETGATERNLPLARQTIDILGMLEHKTRCNLTEQEEALLQQLLFDLRIRFVDISQQGSAAPEGAGDPTP